MLLFTVHLHKGQLGDRGEKFNEELMRPSQGEYKCRQSKFQNWLFCLLRRRPCHCRHFTIVFAIVSVSITVVLSTHLCVVCSHFIFKSHFFGHVTCWILPWQGSLMYGLSAKKVTIAERWALVELWLYNVVTFVANKIMYPREKSILSHRN